jgi:PPE family
MKVDPTGLRSAAQRIMAALAQLPTADALHPPLAADPVSQGAAIRLTSGGSTLAALLADLALGLAATADVLAGVGIGFGGKEHANTTNLTDLGASASSATVTGYAPPPGFSPDVRPPLPPLAPMMGEAVSRATHTGDIGAAEEFITGWTHVADAVDDAAAAVAQVVGNLPDVWNSELSTPVVRSHLLSCRTALSELGQRARRLAGQANRHADDLVQARQDIPPPHEFDRLKEQTRQTWKANLETGGKYAPALAALHARNVALNDQAVQGHANYHVITDTTTAPDPAADAPWAGGTDPAAAAIGDPRTADQLDPTSGRNPPGDNPHSADQLAGLMSTMLPTVLAAVGGLTGGMLSAVTKAPEALGQAVTQAAGAAMQGLSGALGSPADTTAGDVRASGPGAGDPAVDTAGPGSAGTTPASGADSPTPSVRPSTGPAPTPPTVPAGALPEPTQGASGPGAMMPMAMPMGAMMPGGATAGHQQKGQHAKHLVVPRTPHTESVTGKVSEDRIARSASPTPPTDPRDELPPHTPQQPQPTVRRITMTPRTDDLS